MIPKVDHPNTFEEFKPISLCNFIYKVIGKLISIRIRKVLGHCISGEQFGFLPGRHIHDVVGVLHEVLHSIPNNAMKLVVLKN